MGTKASRLGLESYEAYVPSEGRGEGHRHPVPWIYIDFLVDYIYPLNSTNIRYIKKNQSPSLSSSPFLPLRAAREIPSSSAACSAHSGAQLACTHNLK